MTAPLSKEKVAQIREMYLQGASTRKIRATVGCGQRALAKYTQDLPGPSKPAPREKPVSLKGFEWTPEELREAVDYAIDTMLDEPAIAA